MSAQRGPLTGVGQRPTTLSGAAAEVEGDVPKKSRVPLMAIMGGVLALAAGGGFVALRGKDAKTENHPVATVVTRPSRSTPSPRTSRSK